MLWYFAIDILMKRFSSRRKVNNINTDIVMELCADTTEMIS